MLVDFFKILLFIDATPPVITLTGDATVFVEQGQAYVEQGATATDAVDDDNTLTLAIVATGTVDTSTVADYTVTYDVTDSSLNAATSVDRTVSVTAGKYKYLRVRKLIALIFS